jgi:ubiquinol-cytochrome c reductase cytochrome b subunit
MSSKHVTLRGWIDARFPLTEMWNEHLAKYYAPKNFNFWYFFGSLALLVLVMQILTGIFLAMYYTPTSAGAFASVEYIMRDVKWGWLIRYMHAVGGSAFFIIIYLHMFRGLMYGSHKKPRELIWIIGMVIYVLLMAEAFMGYLLPWGQMSFWGATVITALIGAIPYVGDSLQVWLRGDFAVSGATLHRFFAWHVVLVPMLLLVLVVMHILALHQVGSSNPDGVDIKKHKDDKGIPLDGIPFHPYYTVKDLVGMGVFLTLFCAVVFFRPGFWGWFLEHTNFIRANALHTPQEIRPLWYFLPFYEILRTVPNKLMGVVAFATSIVILFFMPWLDHHRVKSQRYRGLMFRLCLIGFALTILVLGYLGASPPTPYNGDIGFRFNELYFSFFILCLVYSKPRSTGYYIGAAVVAGIVIFVLDWLRVGDIPIRFMARSWWIPAAYWAFFLLMPAFTRLGDATPVPERVTFK